MEEQNGGKKSVKIIPSHDTHKGIDSQNKILHYREQTHSNESKDISKTSTDSERKTGLR